MLVQNTYCTKYLRLEEIRFNTHFGMRQFTLQAQRYVFIITGFHTAEFHGTFTIVIPEGTLLVQHYFIKAEIIIH